MKVFLMDMVDDEGMLVGFGNHVQDYGHQVRYWTGNPETRAGAGILDKVRDWKASVEWADLTILSGNCDYPKGLDDCFGEGYPIFGTNPKAAELELDRGKGQEVLEKYGIETAPYTVVSSVKEGIDLIRKTDQAYAMKPWGGEANKALTCVAKTPEDAVFTLLKWEKEGLFSGQLMMQEKVDGIEMGISAFFGPGGFSAALEESFEHKKFLNDDLGGNTGEMGTVLRHTDSSALFDSVLAPLEDYLHLLNYVGDVSVNCIIDSRGKPWPLEFTMRLGWPDFNIRQEVIKGDPVEWMHDLLFGRDTLDVSTDVAVGVIMAHGDFPHDKDDPAEWSGYPLRGLNDDNYPHIYFQQMQYAKTAALVDGKVRDAYSYLTAGTYNLVCTGKGRSVSRAADRALEIAKSVYWPSNVVYRTDIGKRLEEQLPLLQKHGYAVGMKYA